MSDTITNCGTRDDAMLGRLGNRMSVEEIARRLDIGRLAVYAMLEQGLLPGIRLGRRWIVTRHAYEQWERTCGVQATVPMSGLQTPPEVCC
jgi:excisionase family DNA binding protein